MGMGWEKKSHTSLIFLDLEKEEDYDTPQFWNDKMKCILCCKSINSSAASGRSI